mmetsp:Transcript_54624/g.153678  ORF Transcript_54624/g.153678 Transcript_54624/m.153678 type:complete len:158 (+) Transcript_54624:69-542(+)|eukprot:CAMPEP_0179245198 /NCGR_PEP_ID=MMETSP0797-20121207/18448_1 /TAXON_ID=47934 /ORGANISM="Dinophysis acuminata, Strain DAEP01" /LENGTH=157 /DNA_ID=CAMNT_0020952735 /DNA_START=64 /DNA_END=537 /DNA_ORIENTATION=-
MAATKLQFNGTYSYATGDMFCGMLDVTGKPSGNGVLYYFNSGECDVGVFDQMLNQTGEGVRYTRDRDAAYRLVDGQLEGGSIDLEEALNILGLQDTPAIRTKDSIPGPTGYDPARHKQTQSYYNYRVMAGLPVNESPLGPTPYMPIWTKMSSEVEAQ